ncbi:TraM-binding TraD/TraG-like protein [Kineococcus xinjiangensis]|uniref:TraM-binding TraD/TraG-like protein n=1 Tax=Kineococcus xinjiangensis TaxID=512762 RepID=A0A2S6IG51_9ACTN|nr:TraM recognition domain-containing protein [Kineococcus xinjiangensis]PPK93166.1 TraM-binding TraD/TraG-like protein [Kineococcus xinjiangensis]
MSATGRGERAGLEPQTLLLAVGLAAAVTVTAAVNVPLRLAAALAGAPADLPANPFELTLAVLTGRVAWPATATWLLAASAVLLALTAGAAVTGTRRARGSRTRVDRAAPRMGRGRDLASLTARGAAGTAARLGVQGSPGLPVAVTIPGGQVLHSSWEDVSVDIWGPRTGKTTCRAIPAILAAPGAVLATSNKRDIVDATRDPRAAGGEVWVFDPQGIADEPPRWWWNPLSYVTDEVRASVLAELFATASREPGARTDAFFDPAGRELLAGLLLAAALDARPLDQVYLWLTDPTDDEPADVLRRHDFALSAAAVAEVVNSPEKQRAGVYGTAKQSVAFLTNRQALRWVVPDGPADGRRQFDPHAFVRTRSTLYSLSREGGGSAGPLVTALTVAVTEAAEDLAKRSPGGRLPVPMVAVLDEAANVCRWRDLPNLYSHYGSRGICIMTILQSWSQGVEVWGREGMRKLWSAANVRVYGGGVAEVEFLSELSQLIGDTEVSAVSVSRGKGGRSVSRSTRRERILDVADLGSLPRGRAVVIASGAPPTLARTLPWSEGPHAAAVAASISAHDPAARHPGGAPDGVRR